jgi:hypothetical protein
MLFAMPIHETRKANCPNEASNGYDRMVGIKERYELTQYESASMCGNAIVQSGS